jgi:hypothetical protein
LRVFDRDFKVSRFFEVEGVSHKIWWLLHAAPSDGKEANEQAQGEFFHIRFLTDATQLHLTVATGLQVRLFPS